MLLHQKKNHYLRIGLAITAVITAMALVGCFWTPYAPTAMSGSEKFAAPSLRHLFGTDNFGRDIFSRVMVGARTTFFISACTVTIGAVVGTLVGALTGYFGGLVDELLMRVNDAVTAFPSILLALVFISLLGFGTMRLPTTAAGDVDTAETEALLDYAMTHGVNYYDTAWPYMQNQSETVVGRCLKKYPRESFYLATKFPGHMLTGDPDPAGIFEQQLEKCQVEYFDFYLLHNVYENDMDVYTDPKWGIIDYFLEQKRLGRIRHLGFSSHADIPCLTAFLERCGKDMEFCQLRYTGLGIRYSSSNPLNQRSFVFSFI